MVPSFIMDKATLAAKALFHSPDTACNEQALQSVICPPAHGQMVDLTGGSQLDDSFRVEGFAYSGGGSKVQKVEISLNQGET